MEIIKQEGHKNKSEGDPGRPELLTLAALSSFTAIRSESSDNTNRDKAPVLRLPFQKKKTNVGKIIFFFKKIP